jgi:hypothetical protein
MRFPATICLLRGHGRCVARIAMTPKDIKSVLLEERSEEECAVSRFAEEARETQARRAQIRAQTLAE